MRLSGRANRKAAIMNEPPMFDPDWISMECCACLRPWSEHRMTSHGTIGYFSCPEKQWMPDLLPKMFNGVRALPRVIGRALQVIWRKLANREKVWNPNG